MLSRRSVLSVPGHKSNMHEKASSSNADCVMLDLEDSVPESMKSMAREKIINSLNELDWGNKTVSLRINSPHSKYALDDLMTVMENAGEELDTIVIPKVSETREINFVDMVLAGLSDKTGLKFKVRYEVSIESPRGLLNIEELVTCSEKIDSLVFGIADYSTELGLLLTSVSGHGEGEDSVYPGHRWHYVLSRLVTVARAYDLYAIDAAYGNFRDTAGLEKSAKMSAALGFDGKWAIHPAQVDVINRIYSPADEQISLSKKIIQAHEEAVKSGEGAANVDGRMVDHATVRLAKKTLQIANECGL